MRDSEVPTDRAHRIAVIKTDKFAIGFMGRTGGRSIIRQLAPKFHPHFRPDAGKALPSAQTGHAWAFNTYEYFNSIVDVPKILVHRDPVDRAVAGSKTMLYPDYHGAPYLHNIDINSIDYIIKFDRISEYVNYHRREDSIPYGTPPDEYKRAWKATLSISREQQPSLNVDVYLEEWDVEDYDFADEINLYNTILNSKQELAPELWREWCSNYTLVNNFPVGKIIINDGFEL